jgi:uncharacterized protein YprB with RNaseH-like and TPR domain
MGSNLRDRLLRIKEIKKEAVADNGKTDDKKTSSSAAVLKPQVFGDEWVSSGFQTLKRTVELAMSLSVPSEFPDTLGIVIPDFNKYTVSPGHDKKSLSDLLFFDLETTGLSGGAGTVAFLAAFGRFTKKADKNILKVVQYLLLDYSGQYDFLTALLEEFTQGTIVVSYNGKTFDSQILKTMCLMNGITPPQYHHADLLHPARRLWKRVLPNCSQGEIEKSILGLDREGDIPGALAPDIWFDFLKSGKTEMLLGICDHNIKDINGLASLFITMTEIAKDPIGTLDTYHVDAEKLALCWRVVECNRQALHGAAKTLLEIAAVRGYFESCLRLAIDAEWYEGNIPRALEYTNAILNLENLPDRFRQETEKRKERLLKKISRSAL